MRAVMNRVKFLKHIKVYVTLITVFAIIILVKSPLWFEQKLPEDNFTSIAMLRTLITYCVTEECEGDIILEDRGMSTASGLAFRTIDDVTYILTANHFCNPEDHGIDSGIFGTIDSNIFVSDSKGELWSSKIAYSNSEYDLCLVESEMPEVMRIMLAEKTPEVGEKVYTISAPEGFALREVGLHFEGFFSGCDYEQLCYYTIPSTFGSSGSIILNRRSKIIGMIQMSPRTFDFTSIGVGVDTIRKFLNEASAHLGRDLAN
jgi:hypothetical protein